jgi:hypothetical protein
MRCDRLGLYSLRLLRLLLHVESKEPEFTEFPVDAPNIGAFVRPPAKGSVAQLVEQRTENPCVTGSIPVRATINNKGVAQILNFAHKTSVRSMSVFRKSGPTRAVDGFR